jgi:hypothetical protein
MRQWMVMLTGAGLVAGALACGTAFAQQDKPPAPATSQAPAPGPAEQANPVPTPPKDIGAPSTTNADQAAPTAGQSTPTTNQADARTTDQPANPAPKTYQVPAGTKVLLSLKSAVNTRSARPGDGVYLISSFPVVVGNRVMIPAGVYVQGTVDRVVPPGHGWKRGELAMHFTSIIFPNGTVVTIPGVVNSLPGSAGPRMKNGEEGTIQGEGNGGRIGGDLARGAEIGAGPGVIVGAVKGAPLKGLGVGAAAGAAGGLIYSLLTRGKDVNIEAGSQIEMVLQRPLLLEEANLDGSNVTGPPQLVPAAQREPLKKPNGRPRILCPAGLGCSN